tara:strand:- start:3056 stop:3241 length:186 start_codon:yes stop_codon:yes gene_type:complete
MMVMTLSSVLKITDATERKANSEIFNIDFAITFSSLPIIIGHIFLQRQFVLPIRGYGFLKF